MRRTKLLKLISNRDFNSIYKIFHQYNITKNYFSSIKLISINQSFITIYEY